ncbi:flagellar hook-associated protein FlgK [Aneurinibacillus thermoaerophilus]|uniref:flagellar hook-associated protein FlgK n=1 Tax=Aneurinibacillus thermoaerophilus TaxID=143495 RepID=UPI002E21F170|nr:flagellar hook-associated protein FlgK [Aneurinibacillus thermoaerophilus]MED0681387.1 flagellar hook-associated protein FlgK [Aneurinibacillus thermoaerophilus]MED0763311.1 flagellar hook-associated protein FlgK [Aneurinibacillus thermoaerophilus]
MRSTFGGLEIAKRGLFAQQAALNVTGHNIANTNTEGYTRQRANMEASMPFPYPSLTNERQAGQMGTGVIVSSIQRLRDRFLDAQFRSQYKNVGQYEARTNALEQIEVIMNEPSDKGLRYVMDEFWNSWQKVSQPSADYSTREYVIQKGKALAEMLNFIDRELKQLQKDFNSQVEIKAEQLETIVKQIADLNQQISDIVPHGYIPNDLYDKRDVLIDKLSKMLDIEVETVPIDVDGKKVDGPVNITLKNPSGVQLVTGNTPASITLVDSGKLANGDDRRFISVGGTQLDSGNLKAGEIYGLVDSRDTVIHNYITKINDLAKAFIKEVNEKHSSENFFSGADASNIGVAITDPNKVAYDPANPGDNSIALAVYALKQSTSISIGGTTTSFDGFTRAMIATLGVETEEAQRMKENAESLVMEVENRRQSISGVSLDEEMSNMIKFQHAYNAAARTITAVDEMLDKIINGMGIVGR